jgi:pimeloyl-ACP methyl ester carboxylesterase
LGLTENALRTASDEPGAAIAPNRLTKALPKTFLKGIAVLVDLVRTSTRDGVQLDAALQSPTVPAQIGLDGFCLIHGTGSNFYSSGLLSDVAERLLKLGSAVLRINTRGHDGISTAVTPQGGKRAGAAYEVVDDCRHDVAAWVAWMRQRVGPRIGLVGHSMGAVKALYAAAHGADLDPAVIIAISPPRLSYSVSCAGTQRTEFLEAFTRAEQFVAQGEPGRLMEVRVPLPFVITAAGYAEKYGPDERYNFLKFLADVRCLTLITLGGKELKDNVAFQGLPLELEGLVSDYRCVQDHSRCGPFLYRDSAGVAGRYRRVAASPCA